MFLSKMQRATFEKTKILNSDNQMDFHDEEYNYTYGYDSADDYDSEGYYFRVK